MHDQLKALIAGERKNKRELKELRDLRAKISKQKAPDQKVIKMIEDTITNLTGEKLA